ncbi:potassium channel family protein [Solirubrobacter soli]|uniref:potassium channel family protein n=1 Tax=Solirubrobacter soli TaxID=363832 RepID=UPI000419BBB8|nr:potassium channel family protein [Solirubrobacter soli]
MHWRQLENGRVTHSLEWAIVGLALLVIPVILIEESHPSAAWRAVAIVGNWVIWLGFLAELVFVLTVAPRRRAALRAHWLDVVIVFLTAPFLPALLGFLRATRAIRLLRLLRLAALASRALTAQRLLTTRQGFRYIALATILLVMVTGLAMSVADREEFSSPWVGMWWAITTVTTVGYGDYAPHTTVGRAIAALLMITGIGFLSLLTAAIASTFVSQDSEDEVSDVAEVLATLRRIEERLDLLEAHVRKPG